MILLTDDPNNAISILENAVFSAIEFDLIPMKSSFLPTEGELLLMGLYRMKAKSNKIFYSKISRLEQYIKTYSYYNSEDCEFHLYNLLRKRSEDN